MDSRRDDLNTRVTAAIIHAEHLPPGREAQEAFREVSEIEAEIASSTAVDSLQGAIARRGAITAALSAGDPCRAVLLADAYLAEAAPPALREVLEVLRAEALALIFSASR